MKRLICLLITVSILVSSCFIIANAEDSEIEQYISSELDYIISEYYYSAELYNGFFAEGDSNHARSIVYYLNTYYPLVFAEYVVPETVGDEVEVYLVPVEIFEEFVSLFFDISDPVLRENVRAYGIYGAEPGMCRLFSRSYTNMKEPRYVSTLYGYKDLGNGLYEAYAHLIGYDQSDKYVPSENEVEGKDYIVEPITKVGSYSIDSRGNLFYYDINVGYCPAKVRGAVKCLVQFDDMGMPKLLSFEKTDASTVSAIDGLTISDIPFPTVEDNYMLSMMLGAYVNLGEEYYDSTSKVIVRTYTEYSTFYKNIKSKIKAGADCNDLYVYDLKYKVDGSTVDIGEPTEVLLAYPNTFEFEPTVYFIDEAGELVEVDCVVDDLLYIATVESAELGTYIIADVDPDSKVTCGDITGEGKINLIDMYKLKGYLKGSQELTAKQVKAADVNRDNSVNASDLLSMKTLVMKRD